jgi:hypothetical protein
MPNDNAIPIDDEVVAVWHRALITRQEIKLT